MSNLSVRPRAQRDEALVLSDLDAVEEALAERAEEDALDAIIADLHSEDEQRAYRRHRVVSYAGPVGGYGTCPACGEYGARVDGWGAFACDNCQYDNTAEYLRRGHDA